MFGRDCQYGIDSGDAIFSARMKKLLLRSFVLRRRWSELAESTLRSIVNTGRRQGLSAFESILVALNPLQSLFSLS